MSINLTKKQAVISFPKVGYEIFSRNQEPEV